jgi:septin family protein
LCFKVYDTPGYGSLTHDDFNKWLSQITRYIKTLHVKHNNNEHAIRRELKDPVLCRNKLRQAEDNRVHLVLYFFGGGHTIRD